MKYGCAAFIALILIVLIVGLAFYAGQKTDGVALVNAVQQRSTLDEIRDLREQENGRSPLPLICGTAFVVGFFLTIFNMKEINKTLRSVKALSPFGKRARNGRSRIQPIAQYPQPYQPLPPYDHQPQLPAPPQQEEHDHDF